MQVKSDKSLCELYAEAEHERVVLRSDLSSGYRGIIAIHSTALGPAVGGTRFWNYNCEKVASLDALRLSRSMSYKNALAGLPFGGGKAVIIADSLTCDRKAIFRAHGRFIESLKGQFITGEDVGTSPSDMEFIREETSYVAGLPSGSGDPSPMTAFGVFRAMQACAKHRWGSPELKGRTVAIQGCGHTGYHLAKELYREGAKLVVSDIDRARVKRVVDECEASEVHPDEIVGVDADAFAPCAFGGVINGQTIPELKVEIIVGAANNQLLDDSYAESLAQLDILYGPDYVANAGGVINGCRELLGWSESEAKVKVSRIYDRMLAVLEQAQEKSEPPSKTANRMARQVLASAKSGADSNLPKEHLRE
jgi:leucine dehydrogenase